jgi:hypothetical protein
VFRSDVYSQYGKYIVLAAINLTRRQHHYNYLSMNEIFTSPPLETDPPEKGFSLLREVVRRLVWFTFFVYLLIVANDLVTFNWGTGISRGHTFLESGMGIICLVYIFRLARICTKQKKAMFAIYKIFKDNEYQSSKEGTNEALKEIRSVL